VFDVYYFTILYWSAYLRVQANEVQFLIVKSLRLALFCRRPDARILITVRSPLVHFDSIPWTDGGKY